MSDQELRSTMTKSRREWKNKIVNWSIQESEWKRLSRQEIENKRSTHSVGHENKGQHGNQMIFTQAIEPAGSYDIQHAGSMEISFRHSSMQIQHGKSIKFGNARRQIDNT